MPWSWARDLTTSAAQALPEALCVYAYVLVLTPPGATAPGFAALLSLFVLGAWTGRAGHLLSSRPIVRRALLFGASLAILPAWWAAQVVPRGAGPPGGLLAGLADGRIAMAPMLAAGLLGLAVWCRGLWLGTAPASTETLTSRFLVGSLALISLAILLAVARGTGVERYTHTLQLLVLGYFAAAPAVLALVHMQTMHDRNGVSGPVSLTWVLAQLAPMALIMAIGLLLTHDFMPAVASVLHGVGQAVLLLAGAAWWVLRSLLDALLALFPSAPHGVIRPLRPPAAIPPPWLRPNTPDQSAGLPDYLLLIPVALLTLAFARLMRRRIRPRAARPVLEERTSLWSWQLFRQQLRAAWAGWIDRNQARRRASARIAEPPIGDRPGPGSPPDIRAIYRAVLRWAAAEGHRRRAATTPQELQHELVTAFPEAGAALTLITRGYEDARYGETPLPSAALAAAKAAWDGLGARGTNFSPSSRTDSSPSSRTDSSPRSRTDSSPPLGAERVG